MFKIALFYLQFVKALAKQSIQLTSTQMNPQ